MRMILALMAGLALGACGADGEPIQPTANANVNVSTNGVSVGTNLRVGHGPFAVNLGVGL